jgi:aspartate racemase
MTAPMATIGLLGGMSWESSIEYYRHINEAVRRQCGGLRSASCVMYSVDFAEIAALQSAGRWQEAGTRLGDAASAVQAAGADFLLLCTNTMHKVVDQVIAAVSIPLLDIRDVTAEAVTSAGVSRVGLLATAYTMTDAVYADRFAERGLDVIVPSPADRETVHRVIFDELCTGVVRAESRAAYRAVIDRLVARGAQGVILGCTEIELLIGPGDSPVPVFPTTRLHAQAAVDAALAIGAAPGPDPGHHSALLAPS